jgi:hypothetical protein
MPNTAKVHGLFLDADGSPLKNTWVQFEARVDLAPLADKSALVVYEDENAQAKTDAQGRLPMTEIIGSDATGVDVPWSLVMVIKGKRRERFRFLAPVGSVIDLATVTPIPEGEEEAERWAGFAVRAEAAAERTEDMINEFMGVETPDAPSFTLLFENGLV